MKWQRGLSDEGVGSQDASCLSVFADYENYFGVCACVISLWEGLGTRLKKPWPAVVIPATA